MADPRIDVVEASLLGVLHDVPCRNAVGLRVHLGNVPVSTDSVVRREDWARGPCVSFVPARLEATHTVLLLEFGDDAATSHTLLWAVCNVRRSVAEGLVLRPYSPPLCPGARLVFLCCEQAAPLGGSALDQLAPGADAPPRVQAAALLRALGLRVAGLRCALSAPAAPCSSQTPEPGAVPAARADAAWSERWRRGGRFLRWVLEGSPVAGMRDFAHVALCTGPRGEENHVGDFRLGEERAVEFRAVATAWHAASLLAHAAVRPAPYRTDFSAYAAPHDSAPHARGRA